MTTEPTPPAPLPADDHRQPWTPPLIHAMRAGDAEAGPIPVNPEGGFGFGS